VANAAQGVGAQSELFHERFGFLQRLGCCKLGDRLSQEALLSPGRILRPKPIFRYKTGGPT
jgi:hypothetical protein